MNHDGTSGLASMRWAPIPLLLVLLALPVASAHAVLQSAVPPVDGNAPEGTTLLELAFTENLEREYTGADLFDLQGVSHRARDATVDPNRPNVLLLATEPLAEGVYQVAWQALSVDGHTTRGSYLISIGNATLVPVGATTDHTHGGDEGVLSREGFTRAVFYGGLLLAFGVPLFDLAFDHERGRYTRRLLQVAGTFALLGALGGGLGFYYFTQRADLAFAQAFSTETGRAQVMRSLFLLGAGGALFAASHAPPRRQVMHATFGMLFAFGAITFTALASHAASVREATGLAILGDLLHLLAASAWLGGIVGFVLTVPGRTSHELALIIARFSPVATGSVVVILGSGIYASTLHMRAPAELWTQDYGRLVLAKIVLLFPLLLMGAYNQRVVAPRLRSGRLPPRHFHRVVRWEALAMVGILLAAGALATTPPPSSFTEPESAAAPFEASDVTETTHVVLIVSPNPVTVGVQRIQVQLHPLSAKQVENSTLVALKFQGPGEPEPDTTVEPDKVRPDDWRIEGGFMTKPGTWKVHVLMQRPDEYKKLVFEVPVVAPESS